MGSREDNVQKPARIGPTDDELCAKARFVEIPGQRGVVHVRGFAHDAGDVEDMVFRISHTGIPDTVILHGATSGAPRTSVYVSVTWGESRAGALVRPSGLSV